jgi:hypothetical protein
MPSSKRDWCIWRSRADSSPVTTKGVGAPSFARDSLPAGEYRGSAGAIQLAGKLRGIRGRRHPRDLGNSAEWGRSRRNPEKSGGDGIRGIWRTRKRMPSPPDFHYGASTGFADCARRPIRRAGYIALAGTRLQ